jgi:hypothetical protein
MDSRYDELEEGDGENNIGHDGKKEDEEQRIQTLREKTRSLMSGRASCERKWRDSQLAFASILRVSLLLFVAGSCSTRYFLFLNTCVLAALIAWLAGSGYESSDAFITSARYDTKDEVGIRALVPAVRRILRS